ncbi:MAG: HNH endonuclease [Clostridia bacterium]|nr:HNH endonuclease [Clostridia bacterium]
MKWKPWLYEGMPTNYEVSEYSDIRNVKTGRILKPIPLQKSGRLRVHLHVNGKPIDVKIYRMAYEAFHGPIPNHLTIDHIDGNINNNHISNLRLLTGSQNVKRFLKENPDHQFETKYSEEKIRNFFSTLTQGVFYESAAKTYNINRETARGLLNGRRRQDLWIEYAPFPRSCFKSSEFIEANMIKAYDLITEGVKFRDILKKLKYPYNLLGIKILGDLAFEENLEIPAIDDVDMTNAIEKNACDAYLYDAHCVYPTKETASRMYELREKLKKPIQPKLTNEAMAYFVYLIHQGMSDEDILYIMGYKYHVIHLDTIAKLRERVISHRLSTNYGLRVKD